MQRKNNTNNQILDEKNKLELCNDIVNDIINEYVRMTDKIIFKLIKKQQTKYENENYPDTQSDTRMKCCFCNGTYTKKSRCIHNKTNKHLRSIELLKKHMFLE